MYEKVRLDNLQQLFLFFLIIKFIFNWKIIAFQYYVCVSITSLFLH